MTVLIHRVPPMLPGQYNKRRTGSVALSCPSCGSVSLLDPYRISDSGEVSPRWSCNGCNWGGELKLVDYAEETVPP